MPGCVLLYPQVQNSFWHIGSTRCWMKEWIHLKSRLPTLVYLVIRYDLFHRETNPQSRIWEAYLFPSSSMVTSEKLFFLSCMCWVFAHFCYLTKHLYILTIPIQMLPISSSVYLFLWTLLLFSVNFYIPSLDHCGEI